MYQAAPEVTISIAASNWILASGSWNDNNIWVDEANWKDA
jgi:hypothetical protein